MIASSHSRISSGDTNQVLVDAKARAIAKITVSNAVAGIRYMHVYDTGTAPTAGSGTPLLRLLIPGNAAGTITLFDFSTAPIALSNGLGYTITTGSADTDSGAIGAADVIVNAAYF